MKWSSWRDLGIEDVPDGARLMRIMANQSANRMGSVRLPGADIHSLEKGAWRSFTGFIFQDLGEVKWLQKDRGSQTKTFAAMTEDWELSGRFINWFKIRRVINTFKPFKLLGADEIVPAQLQQGIEHLASHLCYLFRACLAKGYIPIACRQVKVTFIPKPRKANYMEAKAYCLITV